ncbi:Flagellar L-ring protein precursor [Candidatus Arcanobacter lacustris]|uniref:Flagellar L-ring protein n=1 Tax=Candidatus Arcanibacter lacustris TaxID=1607817 RepID=A0A0F5MQN0_9RICK|nr:Flagellar L-ring protein precursor [Candidatus Arcanobacter lacustris]
MKQANNNQISYVKNNINYQDHKIDSDNIPAHLAEVISISHNPINKRFNYLKIVAISSILLITTSCMDTLDMVKNIGKAPALNQVEAPMEKQDYQPVKWAPDYYNQQHPQEEHQQNHKNSLWKPGARTFFRDQRARRVGDILKVSININDNVSMDNKTEHMRSNQASDSAKSVMGFERILQKTIPAFNPASMLSISGKDDVVGEGKISRSEAVKTQIAAIVTQILPNGNLVIKGHQEVRVNFELREVKVEGIVRPEDITSENIINSDLIAEARISYGGRGNISNLQQPRYGNQVLDIISPF